MSLNFPFLSSIIAGSMMLIMPLLIRPSMAGLSAFGSRPSTQIVSSAQYRSFIMPKVFEGGGDDCVCPTIVDISSNTASGGGAGGGSPPSPSGNSGNPPSSPPPAPNLLAPTSNVIYTTTGLHPQMPNVVYATSYYYPVQQQSQSTQSSSSVGASSSAYLYYPQTSSLPASMPIFPSDSGNNAQTFTFYLPVNTEHLENRRQLVGKRGKRGIVPEQKVLSFDSNSSTSSSTPKAESVAAGTNSNNNAIVPTPKGEQTLPQAIRGKVTKNGTIVGNPMKRRLLKPIKKQEQQAVVVPISRPKSSPGNNENNNNGRRTFRKLLTAPVVAMNM